MNKYLEQLSGQLPPRDPAMLLNPLPPHDPAMLLNPLPPHVVLIIGEFQLTVAGAGRIYIGHESGEGGNFPVEEVEALIRKYFSENF